MFRKVQTHNFYVMPLWAVTLLLVQLLFVTTAQASAPGAALRQKATDCRITVPTGWRPYRVRTAETLAALVMQANADMTQVMQVNCLEADGIEADELLILPAMKQGQTAIQITEQTPVKSAAPAASQALGEAAANMPVASQALGEAAANMPASALLTVISTTATMATAAVAAPAAAASELLPMVALTQPASSLTTANLIAIALFVLGGMGIFFFALRPRADDSTVIRNLFTTVGNAIFLFAGVLIGVILFPMVDMPSFAALPTGASAAIAVTLIGLLVAKELFFSGQQWRTMNRLLNLGIAPLLMLFFLTVATRVAELMN